MLLRFLVLGAAAASLLLAGCRKPHVVFYRNSYYEKMGHEQAQADFRACLAEAEAAGTEAGKAAEVARQAGEGAVTGAAVGGVVGSIRGRPGQSAAAGAAGAATFAIVRGALRWRDLNPVTRRYVEICLRNQGYQPVGWK
ncbi:MAG: hypothetical protein QNK03_06495 [Myxococcota bacterium]|nr:hypothetical protein [Myxococcota bacterium]